MRALQAGGYTGILPDQVPPQGQGVWAPFFGRPAYTMTLLPRLVQQTGARVFLACASGCRTARATRIRFEPFDGTALSDPKATPKRRRRAMNEGIERLIRRLPGQYLWGYARYKQPRARGGGRRHELSAAARHRLHAPAGAPAAAAGARASAPCSGALLHALARPRRAVVDANLRAVLSRQVARAERRRIARETFVHVAQSWLDRSWLWHAPREVVAQPACGCTGAERSKMANGAASR